MGHRRGSVGPTDARGRRMRRTYMMGASQRQTLLLIAQSPPDHLGRLAVNAVAARHHEDRTIHCASFAEVANVGRLGYPACPCCCGWFRVRFGAAYHHRARHRRRQRHRSHRGSCPRRFVRCDWNGANCRCTHRTHRRYMTDGDRSRAHHHSRPTTHSNRVNPFPSFSPPVYTPTPAYAPSARYARVVGKQQPAHTRRAAAWLPRSPKRRIGAYSYVVRYRIAINADWQLNGKNGE